MKSSEKLWGKGSASQASEASDPSLASHWPLGKR